MRAEPASAVLDWFSAQSTDALFVSAVTQAEMLLGARLLSAGRRRKQLESALQGMFLEDLASRVLPFDGPCAFAYADVVTAQRAVGRPISPFDAKIAATAQVHQLVLATRNTADFERCGVKLTNPWSFS